MVDRGGRRGLYSSFASSQGGRLKSRRQAESAAGLVEVETTREQRHTARVLGLARRRGNYEGQYPATDSAYPA
jgi:hypothetical protein